MCSDHGPDIKEAKPGNQLSTGDLPPNRDTTSYLVVIVNIASGAGGWRRGCPWLGSVITGATNAEQVSTNVAAGDCKLTAEDVAQLDKIL